MEVNQVAARGPWNPNMHITDQAFIMDVGSSNGTFLNGERLSAEGVGSMPWALKNGDQLDFGVDIINVDNDTVLYKKVSLKVTIVGGDDSAKSLSGTAPSATKQKVGERRVERRDLVKI